jgi:ATP-dependent helicase/nuclease subunit B
LLARWGIEADDSAGRPLSATPAGTLVLGIASAAAEELAPVPLLALLKHPLVGADGDERIAWLDAVRELDLKLRGPRPPAGLAGLDAHFAGRAEVAWRKVRPAVAVDLSDASLGQLAAALTAAAERLAGERAWRGPKP